MRWGSFIIIGVDTADPFYSFFITNPISQMVTFFSADDLGISAPKHTHASPIAGANDFSPIGIGKPLIIRLHTVYVGNLKTGILKKRQDIVVTSMIKDDITYDVPPRGVHQIFDKAKDRELLIPKAANEGTELIYYTKAFDQNRLLIDIEVKADKFDQNITDNLSDILSAAGGLPVFMPHVPYLLTASQLIKTGGEVINKVVENTRPLLTFSYNVSQDVGGLRNTQAGYKIGIEPQYADQIHGFSIKEIPGMENVLYLEKDGKQYDGDIPYIIISLDGSSQVKYENFKPTIASAYMLKKFYGQTDKSLIGDLNKIMEVYNDYNYIGKIDKLTKEIKGISDLQKKKDMEELLKAYKENITNKDIFKAMKK